jgi:hypothetical protein
MEDVRLANGHGWKLLHAPGEIPAEADPCGGAPALRAEYRSYVLIREFVNVFRAAAST